jgi:hypothetical protein
MQAISTRDIIWALVLGGGAALVLGRYLVRAVRRGRCAGCSEPGCASRDQGGATTESCRPLNLTLGETRKEPSSKSERRKEGRRGPTARQFHGLVAAIAFPFLLLLLASGIGLLFNQEMALDRRPLPAALALPLYGDVGGRPVATARSTLGEAVAAADGVIARNGDSPWHGVAARGPLGTVHDVAWLDDGHLAAATDRGIWISADGTQWDYLADGSAGLPAPASRVVVANGGVWAQTALGPRLSTDGGVSWRPAAGSPPAALAAPPVVAAAPPAGAERAWLTARGWPTWERFTIDLHGGHLLGGRWRGVVLFSWLVLLGLAMSGPLVARARRRHLRERAARARARTATGSAPTHPQPERPGVELTRTAGSAAP